MSSRVLNSQRATYRGRADEGVMSVKQMSKHLSNKRQVSNISATREPNHRVNNQQSRSPIREPNNRRNEIRDNADFEDEHVARLSIEPRVGIMKPLITNQNASKGLLSHRIESKNSCEISVNGLSEEGENLDEVDEQDSEPALNFKNAPNELNVLDPGIDKKEAKQSEIRIENNKSKEPSEDGASRGYPSLFEGKLKNNVFERLFVHAKKLQTESARRTTENLMKNDSFDEQECKFRPEINGVSQEIARQMDRTRKDQGIAIEEVLYEDFRERKNKFINIEKIENEKVRIGANQKKMSQASQQMALKRLEKDIEKVFKFVGTRNDENINIEQVAQIFFLLGIFKYDVHAIQEKPYGARVAKTINPHDKLEERRVKECEFLSQVWLLLNPFLKDGIDNEILFEFLKVVLEPASHNINELASIVDELVEVTITLAEEIEQDKSTRDQMQQLLEDNEICKWATDKLVREFKQLYHHHNYITTKFLVDTRLHEPTSDLNLTFKPSINSNSRELESKHISRMLENPRLKKHIEKYINDREVSPGKMLNHVVSEESFNFNPHQTGNITDPYLSTGKLDTRDFSMDKEKGDGFLLRISEKDLKASSKDLGVLNSTSENTIKYSPNRRSPEKRNKDKDLSSARSKTRDRSVPVSLNVKKENRYLILLEKERIKEEKIREKQQEKYEQETKGCTFQPKIGSTSSRSVYNTSNTFERLSKHTKSSKELPVENKTKEQKELEECTFKPTLYASNKRDKSPAVSVPRGYEETVERMRNVIEEKKRKRRNSIPKKEDLIKNKKKKDPLLYVDVKLGVEKGTARIEIFDGDTPENLSRKFGKMYKLSDTMKRKLEALLREQMHTYITETKKMSTSGFDGMTTEEVIEEEEEDYSPAP